MLVNGWRFKSRGEVLEQVNLDEEILDVDFLETLLATELLLEQLVDVLFDLLRQYLTSFLSFFFHLLLIFCFNVLGNLDDLCSFHSIQMVPIKRGAHLLIHLTIVWHLGTFINLSIALFFNYFLSKSDCSFAGSLLLLLLL